ncbi:uncharacterized protein LOC101845678 [Aplysia californica]|uniref:Uncharacterized protein LOC101845678 n=1 Tax=Aplysia californica TaxID=6500 RepID=A0ABM0JJI6_APLCA|nr:uncharacterized protein LOC101845678 [Aplysia californica]
MASTGKVLQFLLLCLLVVLNTFETEAFKYQKVKVGTPYEIECYHSSALGLTPTGLELWWYHNGKMSRVASLKHGMATAEGPLAHAAKVSGFQLASSVFLNLRVEKASAEEMGPFVCMFNYRDKNKSEKSAVADYVNFVPT